MEPAYIGSYTTAKSAQEIAVTSFAMRWFFDSIPRAICYMISYLSTIGLLLALFLSYPDKPEGPIWLLSFIAFAPLLFSIMLNKHSYSQIYVAPFVMLISTWCVISVDLSFSLLYALILGASFWLLMSVSIHIWMEARSGSIDQGFVVRFACLYLLISYIVANVCGILASVAVQLYRSPFILQPISIFGFGSLEALVILVNGFIAWTFHDLFVNKSLSRSLLRIPVLYLVVILGVWFSIAGVITATQKEISTVKVSTLDYDIYHFSAWGIPESYRNMGRAIQEKIESSGAQVVVLPESSIVGSEEETCLDIVTKYIAPFIQGSGAHVTLGCSSYDENSVCSWRNLAISIDPNGLVAHVYGDMRSLPGQESCTQPGFASLPHPRGFGFSSLVGFDLDLIGPVSSCADLGSSLIVKPSSHSLSLRRKLASWVIRAVENRVAVVSAATRNNAAIIDPFGNIRAYSGRNALASLSAEISLSEPLKLNWVRQHFVYWLFIAGYAVLTSLDVHRLLMRRRRFV